MNRLLCGICLGIGLCAPPGLAGAAALSVVNATAANVNCAFEQDCTLTVTSGSSSFALPGATGTGELQMRTFSGKAGLTPPIKHGYEYRLDLTNATTFVDASCVTGLEIDFGPVTKLQYNSTGPLDDVFVINSAPGTIGLASAEQNGSVITFAFTQPVCAGDEPRRGQSTFFFGLASTGALKVISALIEGPGGPIRVRAGGPTQ